MLPRVACSDQDPTCLLTYIDNELEVVVRAQRIQLTESGLALLGDNFTFSASGNTRFYAIPVYNTIDDNYLVTWSEETAAFVNREMRLHMSLQPSRDLAPMTNSNTRPNGWLCRRMKPGRVITPMPLFQSNYREIPGGVRM